jgi:hypothetical protein
VTGAETLYLRDVLNTHLEMKAAQAEGMRRGVLPLIDPHRAGGQPLLGNPNALPFYPDNLLYLFASPIWALNAHFWIHLMLAPFAMFWMARAWGLSREGSWAGAVCYAFCGFVQSQMSFYNLIAGAALSPALVAACLDLAGGDRRRFSAPAVTILWCLLILAGDPPTALLALLLAIGAVAARRAGTPRHSSRSGAIRRLAIALGCGTLLATPQIVEFLRIAGSSYRGTLGYSAETRTLASWDPRQMVEWLVPFFFGRPDRIGPEAFWGFRFFTGRPPYFYSLYPGLLFLALAAAGLCAACPDAAASAPACAGGPPAADGCRRRAVLWALIAAATGFFFALGRFNPAGSWLFSLGGGLLRYPVKFFLPVTAGEALLAGLGLEAALISREPRAHRVLRGALATLAILLTTALLGLTIFRGTVEGSLGRLLPSGTSAPGLAAAERQRWEDGCLIGIGILALLGVAAAIAKTRPVPGGALILTVHAGAQLFLLAPLLASDRVVPLLAPSPLLEAIPASATIVDGVSGDLFGNHPPPDGGGSGTPASLAARGAAYALHPFAGVMRGRRYELDVSPEGLDSFLTTAARDAVRLSDDAGRVRLLAAWGVGFLILDRELGEDAGRLVGPPRRFTGPAGPIFLYEVTSAAPPMALVGVVVHALSLNDAVADLKQPGFDAREAVVLPGSGPTLRGRGGTVTVLEGGPESLRAEVTAQGPGVLVIQRAFLPLYRVTLDGSEVPIKIADLHRIAIEIPAGRHALRLRTVRRPLRMSFGASLLGLCGLLGLARRGGSPSGGPPRPVR